ncbi:MAG: hypothetical protein ACR65R_20545 [Methylomicrobium sp.]
MLRENDKLLGIVMIFSVLPVLALSYYFSFRSGCLFDGKQGYGDIQAASTFSKWSLFACVAAFVIFSLGAYHLCHRNANKTAAILLFSFVLGIPLLFWLNFEGEINGIQTCSPS